MEEYFWTVNGNRMVKINGEILNDFVPLFEQFRGMRKTPAQIYLENLGFSEEEAEGYLLGLKPKENLL